LASIAKRLRPPARLRPMPDRYARAVRFIWALVFGFALIIDLSATAYSICSTYEYSPTFNELGLDWDVQEDGSVKVGLLPAKGAKPQPLNLRVTGIDRNNVAADATMGSLSTLLRAAPGPFVSVKFLVPTAAPPNCGRNDIR